MLHYRVAVIPHSSLFLARERGNRVVRHSYPYIPASTLGGALNTYFYQTGQEEMVNGCRFGNAYPQVADAEEAVWMPTQRNYYVCSRCGKVHLVTDLGPGATLRALICDACRAPRREYTGVAQTMLSTDVCTLTARHQPGARMLGAMTVGRTEVQRTTSTAVSGRLHMVQVLRARATRFVGDLCVQGAAAQVIRTGMTFRLAIGGQRSRGSGQVELEIEELLAGNSQTTGTVLAETPLLPLPDAHRDLVPAIEATTSGVFAKLAPHERWAAKPLRASKGLVAFLDTLALGSVMTMLHPSAISLNDKVWFYRMGTGLSISLYGLHYSQLGADLYEASDYTLTELWVLGYGRMRWLDYKR